MLLFLILGIVIGFGSHWLYVKSRSGQFKVRWYQWVLGAIAVAFLLLALENAIHLSGELEPVAATLIWGLFGIPAIICAALIWFIPWIAKKVGSKSKQSSAAA